MLGIPPATRVFGQRKKVYSELIEHGEVVLHPTVVDEGDELARRFIIWASAQEALEEHAASEANRSLAPSASFTDTTQANERTQQCEDDIWDQRL